MKPPLIPVLVLFGPTASGKTSLLRKLFNGSETFRAEIVSADSMQVYRGMDIGTAKPSAEERAFLPHHLIDIREPSQQFNVGDFIRLADEACHDITGRGKLPVVSGGTGFYLKNFILGLSDAPPSNMEIREQLKKELHEKGIAHLMEELMECDPVSAKRIHINDEYRFLRALEVFRLCGRPLSSFDVNPLQTESEQCNNKKAEYLQRDNFKFFIIGLSRSREELYHRINLRCEEMFKMGLVEEVHLLFKLGYTPDDPGLRAIGYREFFVKNEELNGKWHLSQDISGVQALIAQNSRRYAKRQETYFTGIPDVKWINAQENDAQTAEMIKQEIKKIL
jgi:tRNA dimethylallyltransferase